ncbi:hypothetical protein CYLTODRAFT_491636 [Cylindrobasidium torrendii FP15055 ss-10]|uniref:Uncharacterized protein n=1 Tax=Cylindrobasidium torrendii FP15055 ss-10 TaxID=1314674 RepID=A0A0D7B9T3_9AGAR|nr:hypothetical protein CYLTODRAFT_491636 [Cylindrobasidium torrendii FP15055 ss-10]
MFSIAAALLSLASLASAEYYWNAPTSGQDLKVGESYTIDFTVARYFKESPGTLTVALTPDGDGSGDYPALSTALRLVKDLDYAHYDSYNATYQTNLTASVPYGSQPGAYVLILLEEFGGYAGDEIEYYTQKVNLVE